MLFHGSERLHTPFRKELGNPGVVKNTTWRVCPMDVNYVLPPIFSVFTLYSNFRGNTPR